MLVEETNGRRHRRPNEEAGPPAPRPPGGPQGGDAIRGPGHRLISHLQNAEASPPSAGLYWKGRREEVRKHERRLYGPFPVAPRRRLWRFLEGVFARRIVENL